MQLSIYLRRLQMNKNKYTSLFAQILQTFPNNKFYEAFENHIVQSMGSGKEAYDVEVWY